MPGECYCESYFGFICPNCREKVTDISGARRKRDEAEESRLEQKVIERWAGPTDDEGAKNGKP
jgi:hypothetical protein